MHTLLDMSSAFNTLDHSIILHRLSSNGINGMSLQWFESYITNRLSFVCISKHITTLRKITHGVHQGFVLGPIWTQKDILFNIYLLPIFEIFNNYKFPLLHWWPTNLPYLPWLTHWPLHITPSLHWLNKSTTQTSPLATNHPLYKIQIIFNNS